MKHSGRALCTQTSDMQRIEQLKFLINHSKDPIDIVLLVVKICRTNYWKGHF